MTKKLTLPILLTGILLLSSCNFVNGLIHDDEVVAKVGRHRLYHSRLSQFIPEGVSSFDSTNLALSYIDSWATDIIFNDKAMEQLSKDEQDVTEELEAYKRSLLRFRYEQRYVADRLDTLVSEEQMREFYEVHSDLFNLERPILKVRFIDISKAAEKKDIIIDLMGSPHEQDIADVSELAFRNAIKYFDSSDTWMDALLLAREFGTDYGTMLATMSGKYIIMEDGDRNDVKAAYVCEIKRSGLAPYEFCEGRIRDYILSARKRDLLVGLERKLLEDARNSGHLQVY